MCLACLFIVTYIMTGCNSLLCHQTLAIAVLRHPRTSVEELAYLFVLDSSICGWSSTHLSSMFAGTADLDANYLDLHSPITDIVVSNSFFLSTGTRLISDVVATNSSGAAPGKIWGLTMVGNSLNHIELVGSFNATDARAEIGHSNVPTSGLGFSAGHRRGSQMTTVRRSISTGTAAGRQRFAFNFSDPGTDNADDILLLPEISFFQYSVVYLGQSERVAHSAHSPGAGSLVEIVFDQAATAIVHVEARCCQG